MCFKAATVTLLRINALGIGLKAIYHGYSMVLFLAKEIEDWKPYLVLCKGNKN
jgi:hypothetical protein